MREPQETEADGRPLDDRALLDDQGHPAQQHRGERPFGDPLIFLWLGATDQQCGRAGDEQIVEDRRLGGLPTEQGQGQQIGQGREQCAARAGEMQRDVANDPCGGDGEGGRDRLHHQHRSAADRRNARENQEQPDRLAVPDVDVGPLPADHGVADIMIELVVDDDDRIAEGDDAAGDRHRDDQRERQRCAGPAHRGARWRCVGQFSLRRFRQARSGRWD